MSAVFVTGPLAWPPLLEVVAGGPVPDEGVRARLEGVGLEPATESCFPALVPGVGAVAEGRLVQVDDPALFERLNFFAAALGRAPVPKHVETGNGRRAGLVFMAARRQAAAPGDAWDQAAWQARWGDVALAAAAEIMGYFGQIPAREVEARLPMILARAAARAAAAATPAPATVRSDLTADRVRVLARQTTHAGFFLMRSCELSYPRLDGGMSPPLRREVLVATDAAIVLPYDPARDRVLLVEQFRMGPYGRGDPLPFVLEPVAGRLDAGETPQDTAHRECREEAGLTLRGLEHMTSHYCSPGSSTEFYHCYLGLTDLPDLVRGQGGLACEHEDIRTHVLSFEAALALIETGEANIGPLVLMLLWLQRERPRLRSMA